MASIEPRSNQIKEMISKVPKGVPIVMLNMLKFREMAAYPDGKPAISGRQAYAKYSKEAVEQVEKVGGKVIWFGEAHASAIGPPDEDWDQIFLVQYPSIEKFLEMINSASYQAIVIHRSSGLKDSRLIPIIAKGS